MTLKILENFKKDEGRISQYVRGRDELLISGIRELLLEMAQPKVAGAEGNATYLHSQAMWSAGYHEALRDIFGFKERWLLDKPMEEQHRSLDKLPKFGAGEKVIKDGILTKGELDGYLKR